MTQNNRSGRPQGSGGSTGSDTLPSLAISPPRTGESGTTMQITSPGRGGGGRNPAAAAAALSAAGGSSSVTVNGRPIAGRPSRKAATSGSKSTHGIPSTMPHIDSRGGATNTHGSGASAVSQMAADARRGPLLTRQKTLPLLLGNHVGAAHHNGRSRAGHEAADSRRGLLPSITSQYTTASHPQAPVATNGSSTGQAASLIMPELSPHHRHTTVHEPASRPRVRPTHRHSSRDSMPLVQPQQQHRQPGDTELVFDKQQQLQGRFDVGGCSEIGAKQENQDVYDMKQLSKGELYVSVLDGHGPAGGEVAKHGTKLLYSHISGCAGDDTGISLDYGVGSSTACRKQALRSACQQAHQSLCEMSSINTHNSGSTVTIGIIRRNQLTMAWLGDSRSVLGREDRKTGKIRASQLTRDHNCDDMVEAARIRRCGGKVQQYYYCGRFVGPKRIWLKEPGQRTPGLMVSRSIGDEIAHSVGCIADPEIFEMDLTARDKVLIVASDGVWDGLSNQRAVEIAWTCATAAEAARAVVDAALEGLRRHGLADNVTAIVVFLPGPGTGKPISMSRAQAGES